eukprot:TRINITY_DN12368_c0_g1_i9.p1 TRINITY_DN12368_c0_g1~~TRINITY_DN12368_c0_g1_i9.p1  ORF type:complete len:180 (-),score=7.75 TRINITY_DN12368_c0_g1_i9:63-602(-)
MRSLIDDSICSSACAEMTTVGLSFSLSDASSFAATVRKSAKRKQTSSAVERHHLRKPTFQFQRCLSKTLFTLFLIWNRGQSCKRDLKLVHRDGNVSSAEKYNLSALPVTQTSLEEWSTWRALPRQQAPCHAKKRMLAREDEMHIASEQCAFHVCIASDHTCLQQRDVLFPPCETPSHEC